MKLTKLKAIYAENYKSKWVSSYTCKSKSAVISKKLATIENFNNFSKQDKFRCNFCCDNAATYSCKIYALVIDRLNRCKVLELCTLFTDPHHSEVNYCSKNGLLRRCWDYKSCCYVGAMCPGLDKSTLDTDTCYRDDNGGSNLLLLIIEVVLV